MSDHPSVTTIMNATPGQCRYFPNDGAGMHAPICGCKALPGLSYCAPHARIVFQAKHTGELRVRRDADTAASSIDTDHEPDLTEIFQ
jgi:hypothetical protein